MSGQQPNGPPPNGPRGWNSRVASPSTFTYRPQSPWTPVAPSPPPIISGPRRPSMPSPAPMSPTPFAHGMSPGPSNLRGTRGTNNMPYPRPQWPQQTSMAGNMSPTPYQPSTFQPSFYPNQQPALSQLPPKVCPSPTAYAGANGPRPFRPVQHQNSYGGEPASSFQLSPTPSPIVCQTPSSEFMYGSNRHTPMSYAYETQHQQQQYPRQQQQQQYALPSMQQRQQPQQRPQSQNQYDFVGVPLEPPQPKSYVIYDDEEEYGPSTAEIIANQSQDYVDEKLAEYQMTILQLQGNMVVAF